MPTYTYKCTSCDADFEEQRKIEERDRPLRCPACGEGNLKRQLDAPGFTIRPRGWDSGKAKEEKMR